LEEERKREERERNLMALEDQNIKSDDEDEEFSDEDYWFKYLQIKIKK